MAPAPDFQKIITDARERKKNSALADRIFSRDRRQSAPTKLKATPTSGGSLASRVGVTKRAAPSTTTTSSRRVTLPAGNVNGEWTHDLHDSVNGRPGAAGGSLRARITQPGASSNTKGTANRQNKLAAAVEKMDMDQINVVGKAAQKGKAPVASAGMGLTIRGLAGPFAVMGQNFAPGTTAADIESAMTPVGGEMVSCKVVKTQPFLIVEMVFVSREGGERVIQTFNEKTADGRILKIYPKVGGYKPEAPASRTTRDQVVDGSRAFPDLMDTISSNHRAYRASPNGRSLYSDRLEGGNSRRGRGRGRG